MGRTRSILIDEEVIEFDDKNVTQFIIKNRGDSPVEHTQGTPVYRPVIIEGSDVRLLTLGVVYNAVPDTKQPIHLLVINYRSQTLDLNRRSKNCKNWY